MSITCVSKRFIQNSPDLPGSLTSHLEVNQIFSEKFSNHLRNLLSFILHLYHQSNLSIIKKKLITYEDIKEP